MKKRFTEEQIIGFLREADAEVLVADLCRRHGFSAASYLPVAQQVWRHECLGSQKAQGAGVREYAAQAFVSRDDAGS